MRPGRGRAVHDRRSADGRLACAGVWRVVNALEPEWEARFEPKSYGFRPGRGCQDAISAIYLTLKGKNPQRVWVLDADLKAAFDRIDHDHLLSRLGAFPGRGLIAGWLKAGVLDRGQFARPRKASRRAAYAQLNISPPAGCLGPVLARFRRAVVAALAAIAARTAPCQMASVWAWTAVMMRSHRTLSKNFWMSRSPRGRPVSTRVPRCLATTVCATRSATVGMPSILIPLPWRFQPLGTLPLEPLKWSYSIEACLPTFRARAADQAHVTSMPDTIWPVSGHPPDSSQGQQGSPVLMSPEDK